MSPTEIEGWVEMKARLGLIELKPKREKPRKPPSLASVQAMEKRLLELKARIAAREKAGES